MSIATALFSDSQSRVYRWLFGQPEREFHFSQLRRLTHLGSASLQRELNRLAIAGLVQSERIGNLRRFRANPQSPVFNELVNLTRKTLGAEPLLRVALQALTPDLHAAWIYGSYAKQTDTALSDIDVMLIGDNLLLDKIFELLTPLEAQLGHKINPTCYTPAEFQRRRAEPDSFVNRMLAMARTQQRWQRFDGTAAAAKTAFWKLKNRLSPNSARWSRHWSTVWQSRLKRSHCGLNYELNATEKNTIPPHYWHRRNTGAIMQPHSRNACATNRGP